MSPEQAASLQQFRYWAFISYAHTDEAVARWLHRALEKSTLPKNLVVDPQLPASNSKRLQPIFRDAQELAAGSDLDTSLQEALRDSAALVVLCSPAALASRWVDREIQSFRAQDPTRPILPIIVCGEIDACFPRSLVSDAGQAIEPLAADLRPGRDTKRLVLQKTVAGILRVGLDEVVQRELQRRVRRLATIAIAATVGLLAAAVLTFVAIQARNEAQRQAQIAKATSDFVVSVFQVADPSAARGNAVTVVEMLDQGVQQINSSMGAEVQAQLYFTLGKVYTGLGLYPRAGELLTKSANLGGAATAKLAASQALSLQGKFEEALAGFAAVEPDLTPGWHEDRSALLTGRAEVFAQTGRVDDAVVLYRRVLADNQRHFGTEHELTGHAQVGLAGALFAKGEVEESREALSSAALVLGTSLGDTHPRTIIVRNNLAAVTSVLGDYRGALEGFIGVLQDYERIFGDPHPELATLRNNIGRNLFELGRFTEARPYLQQALGDLQTLERAEHPSAAFLLNTLGLLEKYGGDLTKSKDHLEHALALASRYNLPLTTPISIELLHLRCLWQAADVAEEVQQLDAQLQHHYPKDPWRREVLGAVRQVCAGVKPDGSALTSLLNRYSPQHPMYRYWVQETEI